MPEVKPPWLSSTSSSSLARSQLGKLEEESWLIWSKSEAATGDTGFLQRLRGVPHCVDCSLNQDRSQAVKFIRCLGLAEETDIRRYSIYRGETVVGQTTEGELTKVLVYAYT